MGRANGSLSPGDTLFRADPLYRKFGKPGDYVPTNLSQLDRIIELSGNHSLDELGTTRDNDSTSVGTMRATSIYHLCNSTLGFDFKW
jgi:hypothetical protein